MDVKGAVSVFVIFNRIKIISWIYRAIGGCMLCGVGVICVCVCPACCQIWCLPDGGCYCEREWVSLWQGRQVYMNTHEKGSVVAAPLVSAIIIMIFYYY